MKKWHLLEQSDLDDGSKITLHAHDEDYAIRVNGRELMSSRHHFSEEQLAVVACEGLATKRGVCVLIGGLGLGYTLRAALSTLGKDARVVVAELLPIVVEWNKNPAYKLANVSLEDPRTRIEIGDVTALIKRNRGAYDAIMLDADNETTEVTIQHVVGAHLVPDRSAT